MVNMKKVAKSGEADDKICPKQEGTDQVDTHCNLAHWECSTIVLAMPTERDGKYEIVAKALAKVSFIAWKLMLET